MLQATAGEIKGYRPQGTMNPHKYALEKDPVTHARPTSAHGSNPDMDIIRIEGIHIEKAGQEKSKSFINETSRTPTYA